MNLKNIDLEKLENLPAKFSMYERFNGRMEYYHLGWERNNRRGDRLLDLAYRIFKGCVGKHMSTVIRKQKEILPKRYHNYYKHWIEKSNSIHNYWLTKYGGYYYIDSENYLCFEPSKQKKQRIQSSYHGSIYRRLADESEANRKNSLYELAFINDPVLHAYYVELITKKISLLHTIHYERTDPPKLELVRKKYVKTEYSGFKSKWGKTIYEDVEITNPYFFHQQKMNSWKRGEEEKKKKSLQAQKEYNVILENIERLKNKDFTLFYRSRQYQKSLEKECHHFAMP